MHTPTKQWTMPDVLAELAQNRAYLQSIGVRSIGLFGSYRTGTARADSDMDFLVDLAQPTLNRYMDVKFWLEDRFGRPVDLVLADTIKARLRPIILQEVVYATGLSPLPGGHPGGDHQD